MKALTIHQPWAWAILHGGKDVENRTWDASHRGRLVIHASRTVLREVVADARRQGVALPANLPTGAVVGVVDLVDVHHARQCRRPGGRLCSPWAEPGVYHWQLARPRALRRPVPCPGARRLWTPPAGITF